MEQERAELMNWNYPIEVATAQRFSPTCSIGNHGRLPTDIAGIGKAFFIGRGLSELFGGSSMATRLYLSAMPNS